MPRRTLPVCLAAAGWVAALVFGACSSSPKSSGSKRTVLLSAEDAPEAGGAAEATEARKRRTVLWTEGDDARVGREASQEVAAEMGLLGDEALDAYVREIGARLLRGVPRRSFDYQFSVVDQYEPNAFALPGGYIFVSRGLLELANSEDELANVIGHEITHADRRHAARQQAAARHESRLAMPWVRAANLAAYGRDMEREADRGGQLLAAAAGYDPMGMSTFLSSLERMERLMRGMKRVPTWIDTHPGSKERASVNAMRAREIRWKRDPERGDTHLSYLERIDGLAVGERPEGGVFEGERFLHPDLGFQIRFPDGWRTTNTNRAVGATSPRGDAVVFLTADLPAGTPRAAAEEFVSESEQEGRVSLVESKPVRIGGIEAWRMQLDVAGRGGALAATVTIFSFRDANWRITGVTRASLAQQYQGRLLATARSFRPLSAGQRDSFETTRLRLVRAEAGEELATLGARSGNVWDVSRTAVANGLAPNHRFAGGEVVKIARAEPYRPARR